MACFGLVKVKFEDLAAETPKAYLVSLWGKPKKWIAKSVIKSTDFYGKGFIFILPKWYAEKNGLQYTDFSKYHRPKPIEPVYNQEPIDELRC